MHNFLYQDVPAPSAREKGNAGLWYNKFFNRWDSPDAVVIPEEGKRRWVDTVTDGRPVGDSEEIKHYIIRMSQLLESRRPDKEVVKPEQEDTQEPHPLYRCYKLESDFVTGLGLEHPIENGFAWHHSLGTPYLPGSSVKGLVRAWAEQWQTNSMSHEDFARIFGVGGSTRHARRKRESMIGSVIFLDALPIRSVKLKADIITPHYSDYYQDASGSTAPADWLVPNPIPLLVVEKGCTFFFGIVPVLSRQAKEAQLKQARADCEKVQEWLAEALEWLGAGAKTAVGYGRFSFDAAETKKRQQDVEEVEKAAKEAEKAAEEAEKAAEERKSMSPLRREMDEAGYRQTNFDIQTWVTKMNASSEADKCEIAHYLHAWYKDIFMEGNKKLNKKHSKRFNDIEAALASCPETS